jgi:glycogen debranching enzyme
MREQLVTFDGSTFLITDAYGDAGDRANCVGLFYADTRHLSEWQMLIDGKRLKPLTVRNVDYYSARIIGTLDGEQSETPTVTIQRDRIVGDGMHEDVTIENHAAHPRSVTLEVCFGADFADLFEVKQHETKKRKTHAEVTDKEVTLSYDGDKFHRATRISFSQAGTMRSGRAKFEIDLGAHEQWSMCIEVVCIEDHDVQPLPVGHGGFGLLRPHMGDSLDDWFDESPTVAADVDAVNRTYRQSLLDLAALRFNPFPDDDLSIPAAGLPWFSALLGRDSLLTSYMTLPFHPQLARDTLRALARLQATGDDPFRDAEPGKLPHELRRGELSVDGGKPHAPYYGSHDVTPLFLIVLDEYERWTGDEELVAELEPAARAGLAWIEGLGDLDGDGYLEYRTRSEKGMRNQSWKDSDNSMLFADGRVAEPPIAGCEVQGYAYDARRRIARLARRVWGDPELADRLEREATALAVRFDADFWCDSRRHPALALDAEKRQVDSLTSNIGHLLWSGILRPDRASQVVDHLMGDNLFTGWGLRTMSAADKGYNPIEYHNGTVWPHDTAIVAEGLRRYGFRDEATRLAWALLEAAESFDHRLPEVFAGFSRCDTTVVVEYPTAACPQAWSAAAPLLALRTLLGLDVVDGALRTAPRLPAELGDLSVRGLRVCGRRVDARC